MAIKIIQHGEKIMRAECKICHCIFEFTISDLKTDGNIEYIRCPECNYELTWWYGEKSGRRR